ncbi:NUDIX hydrolase [Martelella soudanensis]|uniref:NUDIX hydrolase n=1 Tax=unclassified Martelella TaxID=2629616 RepID=UPI0015DF2535|nr:MULTISPECIES: NUDIX hydrolase [unclassified Martelella]
MQTFNSLIPEDWPVEGCAFPVRAVDIRVEDGDKAGISRFDRQVRENWEREIAANPHLFNGRLITLNDVRLEEGRVIATGQIVPYAYHLWWRRQAPRPPTFHSFAMPVIVSADGAIIAIRMSRITANAGKVYCASGSLEIADIVDGRVDIDANMAREADEETGIRLGELEAEPRCYCAHFRQAVMFYRFFRAALDADHLIANVQEHMRHDDEQEIDAVLAITRENRGEFDYAYSMPPVLDLFFADG